MRDRIENELGRVMRDHDREAPGTADLLAALRDTGPTGSRPPRAGPSGTGLLGAGAAGPGGEGGWRRWFVPLAAAAAIAAVVAGAVLAGQVVTGHRDQVSHVTRLACPARYARQAPWVPAMPARVSASTRLVPRRVPSSAVICGYDGSNLGPASGWALSGRRPLTGGLRRLAAQLAWQPVRVPGQQIGCTLVGGTQVNYLIGLTYPGGGRLWVAATQDPNACVMSSNGEFVSIGVIGPVVTKAFTTGRWPRLPPVSCHGGGPEIGRLGQERAMVPAGSTAVTICGRGGRTLMAGYQALVTALNALPTFLSTRSCSWSPGLHGPSYRLLFSYPQGPAVQVSINGRCSPSVDNLGLQSVSARTIVPVIEALLRR